MNADPQPTPPATNRPRRRTHVNVRLTMKEAIGMAEYCDLGLESRRPYMPLHDTSEFNAATRGLRKLATVLYAPPHPPAPEH